MANPVSVVTQLWSCRMAVVVAGVIAWMSPTRPPSGLYNLQFARPSSRLLCDALAGWSHRDCRFYDSADLPLAEYSSRNFYISDRKTSQPPVTAADPNRREISPSYLRLGICGLGTGVWLIISCAYEYVVRHGAIGGRPPCGWPLSASLACTYAAFSPWTMPGAQCRVLKQDPTLAVQR